MNDRQKEQLYELIDTNLVTDEAAYRRKAEQWKCWKQKNADF